VLAGVWALCPHLKGNAIQTPHLSFDLTAIGDIHAAEHTPLFNDSCLEIVVTSLVNRASVDREGLTLSW